MFSRTAEYALRVVVYLASREGARAITRDIAQVAGIPEGYLSKVLQGLGRAGFVHSQRGLHGGFVLLREAKDITLYEVVQSVDPLPRIKTCPLHIKGHAKRLCPLHQRLDDTMAVVEQTLRDATVADILAVPTDSPPLCEGLTGGGRGRKLTTTEHE